MCRYMLVCPAMNEETGRFRKLILGLSGQNPPPPQKLRFPVENFAPRQVITQFPEGVKNNLNPYDSQPNKAKNLKL